MSDRAPLELGDGIVVTLRDCECDDPAHADHAPCGMMWDHTDPATGKRCDASSWIPFGGPRWWTLETVEPLTIAPSLLCSRCKRHGFVRGGKWIPA